MGWPEMPLGEAVHVKMGRQRSPKHAFGDSMIPYLRAANVQDGFLDLDDVKTMNFDNREQARFSLRRGDVLVTEGSGSINTVGASARWDGEMRGTVAFQNTLLRLRAKNGVTVSAFVYHLARWLHWTGRWADVASGTNIFHIGSRRAEAMTVPVPPLAVQRRIVDLIEHIDEVGECHRRIHGTDGAGGLGGLRSSVLTSLLSGTHEIPESYDRFLDDVELEVA